MMKLRVVYVLILVLLCSATVYGWGIAYSNNHFTMEPGTQKDVRFTLQNYVGNNMERIIVRTQGDKEIAEILDPQDYYLIPPKTKDIPVVLRLSIPDPSHKQYVVRLEFIALGGDGNLNIARAKAIDITVDVPKGALQAAPKAPETGGLTEVYEEIEKKIEEKEGEQVAVSGMNIVSNKKISSVWGYFGIAFAGAVVLLFILRSQKKKNQGLGL